MTNPWYLRNRVWPARREAEQDRARAIAASVGPQELPDVAPVSIYESKRAKRNKETRDRALAPYLEDGKGA